MLKLTNISNDTSIFNCEKYNISDSRAFSQSFYISYCWTKFSWSHHKSLSPHSCLFSNNVSLRSSLVRFHLDYSMNFKL